MTPGRQKTLLLALVGAVVAVVAVQFGRGGSTGEGTDSRTELEDLRARIARAEALARSEPALEARGTVARERLRRAARDHLPDPTPARSLIWSLSTISPVAREVGLNLEWVDEERPVLIEKPHPSDFTLYRVKINARGSYPMVLTFLEALEARNPYVAISQIAISAQPGSPEEHRVSLRAEWPAWSDPGLGQSMVGEDAVEEDTQ